MIEKLFKNRQEYLFPVCVQVTLSHGICDSGCRSCPVGRYNHGDAEKSVCKLFDERRMHMSFELFKRVANEVAQHDHAWLRLHSRGEPLLHPDIVEMIRYAKSAGVKVVQVFTNATFLDEKMAKSIVNSKLDVLECSVHGHIQTYERLMRNGRFEIVRDNIIGFRKIRDEINGPTKLVVSAVDQPDLQQEKEAHFLFWSQYADEVIYRPFHSWGNRIDTSGQHQNVERYPCPQLWNRCTVGPTGKVLVCFNCWDEKGEDTIGDLSADPSVTIEELWQSAKYRAAREKHVSGTFDQGICRSCTDWQGSSWGDNSYESLLQNKLRILSQQYG